MQAVIAGWMCGYAMALLSTAALTYLAVKAPDPLFVRRMFPEGVSTFLVAVPLSIATFVVWTMAGLGIASLYDVASLGDQADVLGSPSAPFLLGVAALALMPLPFLLLVARRFWWIWAVMSGAFLGLFGWAMPILASR